MKNKGFSGLWGTVALVGLMMVVLRMIGACPPVGSYTVGSNGVGVKYCDLEWAVHPPDVPHTPTNQPQFHCGMILEASGDQGSNTCLDVSVSGAEKHTLTNNATYEMFMLDNPISDTIIITATATGDNGSCSIDATLKGSG